jgi:hypothetical protein
MMLEASPIVKTRSLDNFRDESGRGDVASHTACNFNHIENIWLNGQLCGELAASGHFNPQGALN